MNTPLFRTFRKNVEIQTRLKGSSTSQKLRLDSMAHSKSALDVWIVKRNPAFWRHYKMGVSDPAIHGGELGFPRKHFRGTLKFVLRHLDLTGCHFESRLCPTSPKVSPGHFRQGWKGSAVGSGSFFFFFKKSSGGLWFRILNPEMIRYGWRAMKDDFGSESQVRIIPSTSQEFWK